MVTVETAMVLPLLVVFALVAVAVIAMAQTKLRCADLAREAARGAARDQPVTAPASVEITTYRQGQTETAIVQATIHPLGWLPAVTVSESATAALEPGGGAQ